MAGGGPWLTGKGNGELTLYDTKTGKQPDSLEIEDHCEYWHAQYSPSGNSIAVATSTGVRLFDADSRQRQWNDNIPNVRRVSWAPYGEFLVAVNMGKSEACVTRAYNPAGKILWTRPAETIQLAVAVSPDSKRVAIPGKSHSIRILDALTGKLLRSLYCL